MFVEFARYGHFPSLHRLRLQELATAVFRPGALVAAHGFRRFFTEADRDETVAGNAELAQVLKRLPGVHDALVLAESAGDGPVRLLAWCVADGEAEALRQELAAQVPDYLLPAQLMLLPALPLTANGKDRKSVV